MMSVHPYPPCVEIVTCIIGVVAENMIYDWPTDHLINAAHQSTNGNTRVKQLLRCRRCDDTFEIKFGGWCGASVPGTWMQECSSVSIKRNMLLWVINDIIDIAILTVFHK